MRKIFILTFFIFFCFPIFSEEVNSLDVLNFYSNEIEHLKDTKNNSRIIDKKIKNIFKNYDIEQYENTDLFIVSYDNKQLVTSHLLPFLFNGNTVQLKENSQVQRLLIKTTEKETNRYLIRLFNKENMIFFENKNSSLKGTIYVFFDFSCPYCQKFHLSSLKYLNESGYNVAYLPFFKNPDNYSVNNYLFDIFCIENNEFKKDLINKAINEEYDLNIPSCSKKDYMKLIFDLADKLNVKGTPTLIFQNGNKIEGYVPLQQLLPEINVNYN